MASGRRTRLPADQTELADQCAAELRSQIRSRFDADEARPAPRRVAARPALLREVDHADVVVVDVAEAALVLDVLPVPVVVGVGEAEHADGVVDVADVARAPVQPLRGPRPARPRGAAPHPLAQAGSGNWTSTATGWSIQQDRKA
jgi:hypothetical protein